MTSHIPVLLDEVLLHLDIQPSDVVVDGTMGFGGHSSALLDQLGPKGRLIGIDQDGDAIAHCKTHFDQDSRVSILHSNYSDINQCLEQLNLSTFDKCLIDCGVSSFQLDQPERGFSHRFEGPLDMRMNTNQPLTAKKILESYSKEQLSDIFYYFGELKHNSKLVDNIIALRNKQAFSTTEDLRQLIKKSYFFRNSRSLFMKTCSQVFQALRIETNQELEHLKKALSALEQSAGSASIIGIITFHSLEDRLVKQFVKDSDRLNFIPKSVVKPSKEERRKNARSRSAKLRVIHAS